MSYKDKNGCCTHNWWWIRNGRKDGYFKCLNCPARKETYGGKVYINGRDMVYT